GEVQSWAGQVLVQAMEVDRPVAVVAGLATVGIEPGAGDFLAPGEGLVRVVHDRRDPHRGETHVGDVAGVVEQAAEVAAEVADIADHAVARLQRAVEGVVFATLVAVVVGRVAVDEAVGQDEVHRLAGERLAGAVDGLGEGRRGGQRQSGTEQGLAQHAAHARASAGRGTANTQAAATSRLAPPRVRAHSGWPPNSALSRKPSRLAATSCGITMKKLKMPMYTPILAAGSESDSIA